MRLLDKYALDNAQVVIIGNKVDLRDPVEVENELHLTKEDGMKAAFCYKVKFMETSAYTNRNIDKTIRRMVTMICAPSENKESTKRKKYKVTFSPSVTVDDDSI